MRRLGCLEQLMVRECQVFHDDFAILIADDPPRSRQVRCSYAYMAIGEAFHIVQLSICRGIVVDGVSCGQVFLILRHRAFLDVDGEGEGSHAGVRHLPVDLSDSVVFDSIEGV